MSDVTLCVLAGGRSRRFGSPKADITIAGVPISAWIARRLRPCVTDTCLSTAKHWPAARGRGVFDRIIVDSVRDAGPLLAMKAVLDCLARRRRRHIDAGADASCDPLVIFSTVDMPLVTGHHVNQLLRRLRRYSGLAGVMNRWITDTSRGGIEPFPSAWRIGPARQLITEAISAGVRAPNVLSSRKNVALLPLNANTSYEFLNINRRADLAGFHAAFPHLSVAADASAGLAKPNDLGIM